MNLKGRGWRWRALSRVLGRSIAPGIDVIVPIYEAYDDLSQCLESLIKYRDQYSIILVNDGSKDTRIRQRHPNTSNHTAFVKAINNAQNVALSVSQRRG
jgi:glycosyltransferase involved in cell wall biosynthesis